MSIPPEHRRLIAAVCAALFFMPFMMSGVNAVLPALGADLGASARELSLVGTFYALGLVIFQLTSGSLGDIHGRRRVFMWGVAIFSVSGAMLGFADSMPRFLVIRFFQGSGGALFNATGLALLASAAPPSLRPVYLGFSSAAVYAGISCGPPLAGLIAQWLSWRWLFWINALTGAAAFLLMRFAVRLEWRTARDEPFDRRGFAVYAAAMACLAFGASELAYGPWRAWTLLGLCGVLLAVFCLMERKVAFPLMDMNILAGNRRMTLSLLAAFVNYCSFFGMVFFFSIYLQVGRGLDVGTAGIFLAVQPFMQLVTTPLSAWMCRRGDLGVASAIGAGLCGLGLLAAAFLGLDTPLWHMLVAQALLGTGISLFSLSNTNIILESAGSDHVGQGAGLTGTVRNAGQLFNMGFVTVTLGLFLGHAPVTGQNIGEFMRCMRLDLVVFGVMNLLAIGCTLARGRVAAPSE
ncbi:MAG: MFS transporter [Desulfovibrio sp.]|jgi:MFS family permease|nr:MFS transporter [Desulfovibrio sp.]